MKEEVRTVGLDEGKGLSLSPTVQHWVYSQYNVFSYKFSFYKVRQTCKLSTWEAETGRSGVQSIICYIVALKSSWYI